MKKVAICISGLPRNVEAGFQNILESIIEPNNNPDIFIHTWVGDDENLKNKVIELEERLKKYTAPARSKTYYENHKEELLEKMEARVWYAMLDGCWIYDHLGDMQCDVGSWSVSLRADQLSRLIDMARETNTGRLQKKLEQTA